MAAAEDNGDGVAVRASIKYLRVTPRKARLVADQVRGLPVERARSLLAFSGRGAAKDVRKLIESAAANAENNFDLSPDELVVADAIADEGPTIKRFRPRAQGRAFPIHKPMTHITVVVETREA